MLASMTYFIAVALLLCAAALAAERVARLTRRSSRWVWAAAMVASVLIPAVISSVSIRIPGAAAAGHSPHALVLRDATSVHLSPLVWTPVDFSVPAAGADIDLLLPRAWLMTSLLLLAVLAVNGILLSARKRSWSQGVVAGTSVYVASDTGPAVVGLLKPRIVIPRWLLAAPPEQQRWVMAHEHAHIDAGDPMLLAMTLALVIFTPWNLPLWWQLHRLRHAIEVDCDTRVLRGARADADGEKEYGMTLITIGRQRSRTLGAVAAMSESRSLLEKRIRILVSRPGRWLRLTAIPLAGLALAITAFAAQITPPSAASPRIVNVPGRILQGYAGSYDFFGGRAVMSVKVDGTHLVTRLTGQGPVGIYPESETTFFAKLVKARITFVKNADGETTALVLHQNGHTTTAPRIDPATAAHIRSVLEAQYEAQTPAPGSEAALRHLIEGLRSGHPDYAAMTPQLAQATREQLAHLHAGLSRAGAIESIRFLGVTRTGVDVYDVKQARGITHWHIVLDADGKVSGAFVQPGP